MMNQVTFKRLLKKTTKNLMFYLKFLKLPRKKIKKYPKQNKKKKKKKKPTQLSHNENIQTDSL